MYIKHQFKYDYQIPPAFCSQPESSFLTCYVTSLKLRTMVMEISKEKFRSFPITYMSLK